MIDPIIRHHHVIAAHKVGLLDARIRLRYISIRQNTQIEKEESNHDDMWQFIVTFLLTW